MKVQEGVIIKSTVDVPAGNSTVLAVIEKASVRRYDTRSTTAESPGYALV